VNDFRQGRQVSRTHDSSSGQLSQLNTPVFANDQQRERAKCMPTNRAGATLEWVSGEA